MAELEIRKKIEFELAENAQKKSLVKGIISIVLVDGDGGILNNVFFLNFAF